MVSYSLVMVTNRIAYNERFVQLQIGFCKTQYYTKYNLLVLQIKLVSGKNKFFNFFLNNVSHI